MDKIANDTISYLINKLNPIQEKAENQSSKRKKPSTKTKSKSVNTIDSNESVLKVLTTSSTSSSRTSRTSRSSKSSRKSTSNIKDQTNEMEDDKEDDTEDDKEDDMNEEEEVCSTCIEKYNLKKHKRVVCNKCNYAAGRECHSRFLLNQNGEPNCMNCHTIWGLPFLYRHFTKKWVNEEWLKHRSQVLFGHEKSYLSTALQFVEFHKELKDLEQKRREMEAESSKVNHNISLRLERIRNCPHPGTKLHYEREIKEMREQLALITEQWNGINHDYNYTKNQTLEYIVDIVPRVNRSNPEIVLPNGPIEKKGPRKTFQFYCPFKDCRGMLDENYYCLICDHIYCAKCLNIRYKKSEGRSSSDHVCKEEDIASLNEIKKCSTQCPKCFVAVQKSEGCDQMWCTQCHTAFSYKTGEIQYGHVHNPEYYAFMRKNHGHVPRNPLDTPNGPRDPCGLPDIHSLPEIGKFPLELFHQQINHVRLSEVPNWTSERDFIRSREAPMYLRYLYLTNRLDEKRWKEILDRHDRVSSASQELLQVYATWCQVATDIFITICQSFKSFDATGLAKCLKELLEITRMANYNLHQIELAYGIGVRMIQLRGINHDPKMAQIASVDRRVAMVIDPVHHKSFGPKKKHVLFMNREIHSIPMECVQRMVMYQKDLWIKRNPENIAFFETSLEQPDHSNQTNSGPSNKPSSQTNETTQNHSSNRYNLRTLFDLEENDDNNDDDNNDNDDNDNDDSNGKKRVKKNKK